MRSETQQLKGKKRGLSDADRALWHHAIRDATPIDGRVAPPLPAPRLAPAVKPESPPITNPTVTLRRTPAVPIFMPRPGTKAPSFDGLDRRTAERLGRGQMTIDSRLDLHGMTQSQARYALDVFIGRAWEHGKRTLLVITGKGARVEEAEQPWTNSREQTTTGVLRTSVPRWLHEQPNRSRVLAVKEAQPRHGGSGALYVLIRRRRD